VEETSGTGDGGKRGFSGDVADDLASRAHVVDRASALARQHVREWLEDANPSA
jgi:hypothetical protein